MNDKPGRGRPAGASGENESGFGRAGMVAKSGFWSPTEEKAAEAALKTARDAGLEVVRISFADQHGVLRGKTILLGGLEAALKNGISMTSTLLLKDTAHRTVFPVWSEDAGFGVGELTGAADFLMIPDPTTFRILPWSPHNGWMLADLAFTDGRAVPISTRGILKDAVARLAAKGLDIKLGLEVEFNIFRLEDRRLGLDDSGPPETPPEVSLLAHGYQYLTEQRYDEMEAVLDLIRRAAADLALPVRSVEVEFGPSQVEFTFNPAGALAQADTMVLFRAMVKQISRRQGLHATFMCRPRIPQSMANGWHLHQSLCDRATGVNLFMPEAGETLSATGRHWAAGLLAHAAATCLLSTPTVNGYKRYQPYALAPDRVQWGRDNKGAMVRALAGPCDPASRLENRVGEPAANPYLYIASQILCGLDGLEQGLEPPAPVDAPYDSDAPLLPKSLIEALTAFRGSHFYRDRLGDAFVDYLCHIKQAEWDRYLGTVSEWEQREYFSIF